jgi:threonine/homoserine/homoserine lactone efflux protein
MVSGSALLLFVAASLPIIVMPGPSVAYILATTLRHGRAVGLAATVGNETGYFVHVAGTVLGVSAVLAASAQAFTVLKVAGAAYLLWLAVRGWRSRATGTLQDLTSTTSARLSRQAAFLRALPVGVLNPKTAIFYLAFLPQFVRPDAGPVPLQLSVFGVVFILLALAFDTCWVLGGSHLARFAPRLRLRVMDRIGGTVMAGLAAATLTTRRAAT